MDICTREVAALPHKCEDPSSDPRSSCKSGHNSVHIFNHSAPKRRRGAQTGESPEALNTFIPTHTEPIK